MVRPGTRYRNGWHVVIYFGSVDLSELWDFFTALPTTVVVDHMGRLDVTKPIDGPEFALFIKFMQDRPNVWSKVSSRNGCRSSVHTLRTVSPIPAATSFRSPAASSKPSRTACYGAPIGRIPI